MSSSSSFSAALKQQQEQHQHHQHQQQPQLHGQVLHLPTPSSAREPAVVGLGRGVLELPYTRRPSSARPSDAQIGEGQALYRLLELKGQYDAHARELSAPLLRVHDAWRAVHPHRSAEPCRHGSGSGSRTGAALGADSANNGNSSRNGASDNDGYGSASSLSSSDYSYYSSSSGSSGSEFSSSGYLSSASDSGLVAVDGRLAMRRQRKVGAGGPAKFDGETSEDDADTSLSGSDDDHVDGYGFDMPAGSAGGTQRSGGANPKPRRDGNSDEDMPEAKEVTTKVKQQQPRAGGKRPKPPPQGGSKPKRPRPAPDAPVESAVLPTSFHGVMAYVRGIIERCGGSAHIDTILEMLQTQWQRNGVTHLDGSSFGHGECKKKVLGALNSRSKVGKELFMKDPNCADCYMLTPACAAATLTQQAVPPPAKSASGGRKGRGGPAANPTNTQSTPIFKLIYDAIPEEGCRYLHDLYKVVSEGISWYYELRGYTRDRAEAGKLAEARTSLLSSGKPVTGLNLPMPDNVLLSRYYSDAELRLRIRVTLVTHPYFEEDDDNPDYFLRTPEKKKGKAPPAPRAASAADTDPSTSPGSNRTRSRAPPGAYECQCGATDPRGKEAMEAAAKDGSQRSSRKAAVAAAGAISSDSRWKKAPSGEFLCQDCVDERHNYLRCPVCAESYKDSADTNWIRCDDCLRWVMMECDNPALEDLHLYDDDNVESLHYSCPKCRDEWEDFGPEEKPRRRARR